MEKWDAYTHDGTLTDIELVRGEPIPTGLYHLVCEVLVKHEDGSYLGMKRAMSKPNYPGYWEVTAGGSALQGENKLQCIKRELEEETGVVCNDFEEIGRCIDDEDQTIFYSFACCVNCDKNSVRLQAGETEDYKWLSEAEFIDFINSGEMIIGQKKRYLGFFKRKKLCTIKVKNKRETIMKCPYCGNEMKKGEIQIGDIFEAKFRSGGPVLWIPEEDCRKLLPKKTIRLNNVGEGYYCESCAKVVATFDEKGAEFLQ